ncbi:MinD/ParA family protein [Geomesophilobacter sediminis]|uniref:MinD/ParA family protein n=1 Tax=Geomesophilobacter sediminis TaxID=2798584 RepID=A0A8J7LYC4_9BACT|nr:MinD/ParA family protein [Geomesophilobacter sediminis]MBJ6724816.1 MinD/ParA family protein [Geomesophilobacter sediminis]
MSFSGTMQDQADTLRQLAFSAKRRNMEGQLELREGVRVISVASGKGGVGKSSVVINLAVTLSRLGQRVLVVDADLGVGDICLLLGESPRYTLDHVLTGERGLEEIVIGTESGIHVLSMGMTPQQYGSLTPHKRNLLLEGIERLSDEFDYILIDTGAGISGNVSSFAVAAKEILLVVTPEPTSIMDAYALVKTLSARHGALPFKLLVNMCRDTEEGKGLYQKLSAITGRFLEVSLQYMGCIVKDDMLVDSVRRRQPLCRLYPDAKATLGFRALAQKVASEGAPTDDGINVEAAGRRKEWRNHELSS